MKPAFGVLLLSVFFSVAVMAENHIKPYDDYIKKYSALAMEQQLIYGIPSSITLAQGLLESNAGNSTLAQNSNNHFGIKCHRGWNGPTYSHFDDGQMSCFRKYEKVSESYKDHSLFIVTSSRYDFLFELNIRNYKGWARGLKSAGYATDKQYANKLIKIIQLYRLDEYDLYALRHPQKVKRMLKKGGDGEVFYAQNDSKEQSAVAAQTSSNVRNAKPKPTLKSKPKPKSNPSGVRSTSIAQSAKDYNYLSALSSEKQKTRNQYNERTDNSPQYINAVQKHSILYKGSVPYIVIQYGDTYSNLADEFGISPNRLKKINEYPADYRFQMGDIFFLNKKMDCWEGENATHTVRDGESVHDIAQLYGLKVKALLELNAISPTNRIEVGQKLKLR